MARKYPTLPDGTRLELSVGKFRAFGVQIENRDGSPRDISTDTLTVAAKLEDGDGNLATKTLSVAKDSPNANGKATVSVPASEVDGVGTLHVDVLVQKSGGTAAPTVELSIPVVAALA